MQDSILPHQRAALDSLLEVGSACFSIARETLSIPPRTNTLIVGPTGTGKSFLVNRLAKALDVPFWGIGISEWMPLGSSNKGAIHTLPSICRFLVKNARKPGVLLFLDELCKLGAQSWDQYVKVEVFRCLDLSISRELNQDSDEQISEADLETAEDVLKNRTFIVGAGAFQDIWESTASKIGFGMPSLKSDISLSLLAKVLPRELTNRFRSAIVALPKLSVLDYNRMLESSIDRMPPYLRKTFAKLGHERIPEAARQQQGVRFLEELVLDTILFERRLIRIRRETQLELHL